MSDETIMCPNCGRWITFPEDMEVGACPACNWVRRRSAGRGQVPNVGADVSAAGISAGSVVRTLLKVFVCMLAAFGLLIFVLFAGCLFLVKMSH